MKSAYQNNQSVPLQTSPVQPRITQRVIAEITKAITNIQGWGSVEIFIQNNKVTQITERNIKKTDTSLYGPEEFRS